MAGIAVPARSSLLDADALARLVADHWPFLAPLRCQIASLSLNDSYRVTCSAGTAWLRVSCAGWRTREAIDAELDLLDALATAGVASAQPIPTRAGERALTLAAPEGARIAVLFTDARGEDAREISADQARAYGAAAARIHAVADVASAGRDREPLDERALLDVPLAAIRAWFPDAAAELVQLETLVARTRAALVALPREGPAWGLCHGDLHPGNARFPASGPPVVFDFDCCGAGWRGYDLAIFLWNAYGERRAADWRAERWSAFLAGYRALRPLPDSELAPLSWFLIARDLWLMGLDCAGLSGYPPQWMHIGALRDLLARAEGWLAEYAAPPVSSATP